MTEVKPPPDHGPAPVPSAAAKADGPWTREATGSRLVLLVFLLGVLGYGALMAHSLLTFSLIDEHTDVPWTPDPAHLGHADVFVVDAEDREIRGHVVADYAGRYSRAPRWPLRRAALEAELPGAIEFVRRRLGLGDRPVPPFRVRFRDDEEMGYPIFMNVFQELEDGAVRPLIVVGVDALVAGKYDLRRALRHELAHCWHLWSLGETFYVLPRWVKEGLADWATGPDCDRLRWLYLVECGPPGIDPAVLLVNGLDGRQERSDYAESWLAFLMIEREFGIEAVHRLAAELFSSGSHRVALRRVTGWNYEEFERRARAWASARVREDSGDRAAYVAARKEFVAGENAAAEAAYASYIREHPTGAFRALALAEQAELRILRGDPAGARTSVAAIAGAAPEGSFALWIFHLRIRIARAEKDWPAVERLCLDFIHDFEWTDGRTTLDVRNMLPEARREMLRAKEGAPGGSEPVLR